MLNTVFADTSRSPEKVSARAMGWHEIAAPKSPGPTGEQFVAFVDWLWNSGGRVAWSHACT